MAKVQPTIIQFDSEKYYISVVNLMLFNVDLEVQHTAIGKRQASELMGKIQRGEVVPTLAIIDTMVEDQHDEGEKIATRLKELAPKVKIIAYTILPEPITWADEVAIKSQRDGNRTMVQALSKLLKTEITEGKQIDKS